MKLPAKLFGVMLLGANLFLAGCGNDKETNVEPDTPKVSMTEVQFDNRFGNEDFALNKPYITASNEQIEEFTRISYFISNVELVRADGTTFKEPKSYHLIQEEDQINKTSFKVSNVPAGNYTKIRFMVGIDSVRNQSLDGATGDLTPDNHMTWMWNTGFIFLSTKGYYTDPAANPTRQVFEYNIGKNRSLRVVELAFPAAAAIDTDHNPKIQIKADAKTIFGGPNVIQVKTTDFIDGEPQSAADSKLVADNYAGMFSIISVNQ